MRLNEIITQMLLETDVEGWSCGETWESITFPDGYEKPPKEEFETKLQQLIEEHKWKDFRQERNKRLAGCDWITLKAYSTQKVVPKVWRDYMQALRDIPSNTEDPENPIWPVAPQ
jgi:hypothetical protein